MEQGNTVRETTDGGFVVCGVTEDFIDYDPEIYVVKTNNTGNVITEVSENKIFNSVNSIYPNPTTGVLRITLSNPAEVNEIIISDAIGNEVQRISNINNAHLSVNLNDKLGVYFVTIFEKGSSSTVKVVLLSE
jgi:hypothetical protein